MLGDPAYQFDACDHSLIVSLAHQLAAAAVNASLLARLQRERNQLEAVLVSMRSGAFLVDHDGQIVYVNPQLGNIIGTPVETFLGHSYAILFQQISAHSGNCEKTRQELDAAMNQMAAFPIVHVTLPQATTVHLQFNFFLVTDNLGQNIGWGSVVTDTSHERERLSQMSDLLSSVSHELRTPLAAIKGFVAMLSGQQSYWGEDGRQTFLNSINESADQLGRLIENVLEMALIDAGVARLRRCMVSLAPIIQRAIQVTCYRDKSREIEVITATDLPDLEIDPLRIEQVLRNLLENALSYSPVGGRVMVSAERKGDEVLISIADQGSGIPEERLTHIFERLHPIGQTANGRSMGAGLGLYISRELVIAHGGRIWATSKPNQGTTMQIALPIVSAASRPTVVPVRADASRVARQSPTKDHLPLEVTTILLVEDDAPTARIFKANLELDGFKIQVANRGQTALDLATQQKFDLILLDLMLPDLDGFQICEQLREFSSVPIIIITGKTSDQDKVHGLGIGADDYLVKPFSPKELAARVRAVLRRAQPQSTEGRAILRFGDLALDLAHRQVYLRGNIVSLAPHEYKLLSYMATNSGRVLSHSQLLTEVWGPEYGDDTQYLWVSISRLRQKLEDNPKKPRYILTDPRAGYHFCEY